MAAILLQVLFITVYVFKYLWQEECMSDLTEMIIGIAVGILFIVFGIWFFVYMPINNFSGNLLSFVLDSKGKLVGISTEAFALLAKIVFGVLISLWATFGCIISSVRQYEQRKQEELATIETAKLQEQLKEEAEKKFENMSKSEKEEAAKIWRW